MATIGNLFSLGQSIIQKQTKTAASGNTQSLLNGILQASKSSQATTGTITGITKKSPPIFLGPPTTVVLSSNALQQLSDAQPPAKPSSTPVSNNASSTAGQPQSQQPPIETPQAGPVKENTTANPATSVSTQGVAGYSQTELTSLANMYALYKAGGKSESATVIAKLIKDADKALKVQPDPVKDIVTSGDTVKTGEKSNTSLVNSQSDAAYSLSLAYAMTGNKDYLDQAKAIMTAWSKTNQPQGDSVANAGFVSMFKGYDMIRSQFSPEERGQMDGWMRGIADAAIADQTAAQAKKGSFTAVNNHRSYALLEVATIGAVLNEPSYIHYVTDKTGFLDHIGKNLGSFPGDPPNMGVDYNQRQAVHYVAYNMAALTELAVTMDRIGKLPGNPYNIDYNPYTVEVHGGSIANTMGALMPYATGEKQSTNEFANSKNENDAKRVANGSLSSVFKPEKSLPALEAASYFGSSVTDSSTGKTYNLANSAADLVIKSKGKLSLPAAMPTSNFLLYQLSKPYSHST